jgi:hypothetical protein
MNSYEDASCNTFQLNYILDNHESSKQYFDISTNALSSKMQVYKNVTDALFAFKNKTGQADSENPKGYVVLFNKN